jgi:hypothetical protein
MPNRVMLKKKKQNQTTQTKNQPQIPTITE